MDIRDVLVVIEDEPSQAGRLDAAITLAGRFGARVTGLYAGVLPDIPTYVEVQLPEDLRQKRDDAIAGAASEAEADFRDRAKAADLSHDWRAVVGPFEDVSRVVAGHSHLADVAVVGRSGPDQPRGFLGATVSNQLVLSSGAPVLLCPNALPEQNFGAHVVIGWNGSREASRALHDSIPFLQRAEEVSVLTVETARSSENAVVNWDDIAAYLARHGIDASIRQSLVGSDGAGEVILSRAKEAGADLIVMGAYGHSRLWEISLGGATRHVMTHADIPVLLSH